MRFRENYSSSEKMKHTIKTAVVDLVGVGAIRISIGPLVPEIYAVTDKHTNKQTDKQTDRQTNTRTYRHHYYIKWFGCKYWSYIYQKKLGSWVYLVME